MKRHNLKQAIWGRIWKHTLGKSLTNATSVNMQPNIQAFWGLIWQSALEKSQTNATSLTLPAQSINQSIFQYTFFGQYPMKFQDFFSLCQVQQPAWLQLEHRKLGPSEMGFSDLCIKKTEIRDFMCDILLWKTLFMVSIECYMYQDCLKRNIFY